MIDGSKGRVLLVSDSRHSATLRVLRRAGYEVVITFTVDHAVAVCASRTFAAVILDQDLFMEIDGWSVAQSIKLVRGDQPVILITHGSRLSKGDNSQPKGVDHILSIEDLKQLPSLLADD